MDALSRRDVLEWAMAESVPVRCPACRREHLYAAPSYPCVCGAPVTPPLDRLAEPEPVTHRVWDDDWVSVRCEACGRDHQWPHPELGCSCGTTLRIPVQEVRRARGVRGSGEGRDVRGARSPRRREPQPGTATGAHPEGSGDSRARTASDAPDAPDAPEHDAERSPEEGTRSPRPAESRPHAPSSAPRPPFQPVTIRTARDAVTAAALYLRWLGYRDIRRADQRPPSGIGLAARGILAQVDPTVRPASLRDVECLWLTAMTESAGCVYFSLAGFAEEARVRADTLGVPLFVLDLTGTPQPVNSPADELVAAAG